MIKLQQSPACWFEPLENRVLRSATLIGNELHITGTRKSDLISVYINSRNFGLINVKIGKTVTPFSYVDVSTIWINGGPGDDRISIDQTISPIKFNTTIYGGLGDDRISGGSGRDRILCGEGDDSVAGLSGSDIIYGDEGDDTISGNAGNDFISGGDGDDLIQGDLGNDRCQGDDGIDHVSGEAGDDTLKGDSDDILDGGDGDDVIGPP
jgi:Ca2+-binding RTX toxin-like protein